jgi:hypothetical protein
MANLFLRDSYEQANSFLNQIEGRLADASTIAELQAVDAELINFESSAGFNHLPTDIIQRFDALQDLVESIEAFSVDDSSEQSDIQRSITETELEKLAKEYAERLAHASTLEHQARTLTTAAAMYETFAFERYENAFERGASEEDWNVALQSARAELYQKHLEEVASIAVRVLNSAEADEVRWDGKVITFIRDENRLVIVDDEGHCVINATWTEEHWEHQTSSLSQAEFLIFKQEIETHLSERVRERDVEQQPELQDILELG